MVKVPASHDPEAARPEPRNARARRQLTLADPLPWGLNQGSNGDGVWGWAEQNRQRAVANRTH